MSDEGFLSRWSRRKVEVKTGVVSEDRPHPPSTGSGQAKPLPQREREPRANDQVVEPATPSLAPLGRGTEGEV